MTDDGFEWVDPTEIDAPHANQRPKYATYSLVENETEPDELAIYPRDCAENEWITAVGQSFVTLRDWR